jgi:hypothetical protein
MRFAILVRWIVAGDAVLIEEGRSFEAASRLSDGRLRIALVSTTLRP